MAPLRASSRTPLARSAPLPLVPRARAPSSSASAAVAAAATTAPLAPLSLAMPLASSLAQSPPATLAPCSIACAAAKHREQGPQKQHVVLVSGFFWLVVGAVGAGWFFRGWLSRIWESIGLHMYIVYFKKRICDLCGKCLELRRSPDSGWFLAWLVWIRAGLVFWGTRTRRHSP